MIMGEGMCALETNEEEMGRACVCGGESMVGRQRDGGGRVCWREEHRAWAEVTWRAHPPGVGCDRVAEVVEKWGSNVKWATVVAPW